MAASQQKYIANCPENMLLYDFRLKLDFPRPHHREQKMWICCQFPTFKTHIDHLRTKNGYIATNDKLSQKHLNILHKLWIFYAPYARNKCKNAPKDFVYFSYIFHDPTFFFFNFFVHWKWTKKGLIVFYSFHKNSDQYLAVQFETKIWRKKTHFLKPILCILILTT